MVEDKSIWPATIAGILSGIMSAIIAGWFAISSSKTTAEAAVAAAVAGTYKRELVTQAAPKGIWVLGWQSGQITFCGIPDSEESKALKSRAIECTKGVLIGVH